MSRRSTYRHMCSLTQHAVGQPMNYVNELLPHTIHFSGATQHELKRINTKRPILTSQRILLKVNIYIKKKCFPFGKRSHSNCILCSLSRLLSVQYSFFLKLVLKLGSNCKQIIQSDLDYRHGILFDMREFE